MAKAKSRDEFSARTKQQLAARAGHVCSFPGCPQPTSGPSAEGSDAAVNVGEACHIAAASSGQGARRYDASMTSAKRRSIDNGIWMCHTHAKLIDSDETTYTVEQLQQWKRDAEARAEQRLRDGSAAPDSTGPESIDAVLSGRIVHVEARFDDGETQIGMGFRLAPGRVLTAQHVVEAKHGRGKADPAAAINVSQAADGAGKLLEAPASVIWRGESVLDLDDPRALDAALLEDELPAGDLRPFHQLVRLPQPGGDFSRSLGTAATAVSTSSSTVAGTARIGRTSSIRTRWRAPIPWLRKNQIRGVSSTCSGTFTSGAPTTGVIPMRGLRLSTRAVLNKARPA